MPKTYKVSIALIIVALFASTVKADEYTADWESMKDYPVPAWFDDAKFGIFIHWGAYSVFGYKKGNRGYAEHTPKAIYRDPEHYYPVLQERFGAHPPEFGYKDMIPLFKAEHWDPEAWAELFDKAGAKYVVMTAEHHDGYALWDSDLTEWCATKVGPMRDLVGDLGKAVQARDMKYAPSYHRERHAGFFGKKEFVVTTQPHPDIVEEIKRMPAAAELYGPFEYTDEFISDYVARWQEIQTKYQPDFMWLDDIPLFYKTKGEEQAAKFQEACAAMIADYLNAGKTWGKDVYLNNKGGHPNWPVNLGCLEKDNLQMERVDLKWENPATLATSYGYLQHEEKTNAYHSSTKLIHLLCDVVSKNGNLLLNIGPRADGTIPEGMQDRLRGIGEWLEVNGEAIYGTRPWTTYGEGITKLDKKKDSLGRHAINSRGIRFTRSQDGKTIYALLLERPDKVTIEAFQGQSVTSVQLLGNDKKVKWRLTRKGLKLTLPNTNPNPHTLVLKIEL